MNSWEFPFLLSGELLILDESLQISEVSPEFCAEFGCQPKTIIGQRLKNLFSRKDRKGKFSFHDRFSRHLQGFLDLAIAEGIINKNIFTLLEHECFCKRRCGRLKKFAKSIQ